MTRTLQATLPGDTLYVSGTVNGVATTWTNTSGYTWETVAERSPDDTYYVVLTIINNLGTGTTTAFTMYYGLHLIYDRTLSDVQKVARLTGVGFANMSETERAEWLAGLKGAYNASDLNRVESAVAFIADYLNNLQSVLYEHAESLNVAKDPLFDAGIVAVYPVTKSSWSAADIPSVADLARYLSNVDMVTDMLPIAKSLPADMNRLTYVSANAIEKALLDVYDAGVTVESNLKDRINRIAAAWYYSDDIYSGEVE